MSSLITRMHAAAAAAHQPAPAPAGPVPGDPIGSNPAVATDKPLSIAAFATKLLYQNDNNFDHVIDARDAKADPYAGGLLKLAGKTSMNARDLQTFAARWERTHGKHDGRVSSTERSDLYLAVSHQVDIARPLDSVAKLAREIMTSMDYDKDGAITAADKDVIPTDTTTTAPDGNREARASIDALLLLAHTDRVDAAGALRFVGAYDRQIGRTTRPGKDGRLNDKEMGDLADGFLGALAKVAPDLFQIVPTPTNPNDPPTTVVAAG